MKFNRSYLLRCMLFMPILAISLAGGEVSISLPNFSIYFMLIIDIAWYLWQRWEQIQQHLWGCLFALLKAIDCMVDIGVAVMTSIASILMPATIHRSSGQFKTESKLSILVPGADTRSDADFQRRQTIVSIVFIIPALGRYCAII